MTFSTTCLECPQSSVECPCTLAISIRMSIRGYDDVTPQSMDSFRSSHGRLFFRQVRLPDYKLKHSQLMSENLAALYVISEEMAPRLAFQLPIWEVSSQFGSLPSAFESHLRNGVASIDVLLVTIVESPLRMQRSAENTFNRQRVRVHLGTHDSIYATTWIRFPIHYPQKYWRSWSPGLELITKTPDGNRYVIYCVLVHIKIVSVVWSRFP
jgi:hypothetical protein